MNSYKFRILYKKTCDPFRKRVEIFYVFQEICYQKHVTSLKMTVSRFAGAISIKMFVKNYTFYIKNYKLSIIFYLLMNLMFFCDKQVVSPITLRLDTLSISNNTPILRV